ncbi:UNVERIFIED_CONTAM: hypothetical protein Scaly_2040200 [Sesamum calycinum]|uniref:Uncharacterized protein n=1 Tax=Sesamum calycinum TaxID=2727403 RepID=A0AAW2N2A1_9LAMI
MNMKDKKDMEEIMNEHINLGLIEPGVSTYSSLGFLVRSHGEIKRGILIGEIGIELQNQIDKKIQNFLDGLNDKKHLQSFLEIFNFASIFIKDLARHRKDFQPLLKEIEGSKWKWEEIQTQRVRELKQVCSYLPKLAILEDDDELNNRPKAGTLTRKSSLQSRKLNANIIVIKSHKNVLAYFLTRDEASEIAIRSSFLASTLLWNDLKESIRKTSPLGKIHELREHDPRYALRVQDSRPVSSDLSTDCTRPSPDSGLPTNLRKMNFLQRSESNAQTKRANPRGWAAHWITAMKPTSVDWSGTFHVEDLETGHRVSYTDLH